MSKGLGSKIGIKFTDDLTGDVTGNESAFRVTGQEYKYVGGPLIDKTYAIDNISRIGSLISYEDDFISGTSDGVEVGIDGLVLGVNE